MALKMVYVGYLVISAWSSNGVMAQEKPHHSTLVPVVITPHSQKEVNYLLEGNLSTLHKIDANFYFISLHFK